MFFSQRHQVVLLRHVTDNNFGIDGESTLRIDRIYQFALGLVGG